MLRRRAYVTLSIALAAYTSVTLFTTSAYGQSPAQAASPNNDVPAAQGPRLSNPEKKGVAEGRRADDLENDVVAVKAENAAVRETLRKMEEQQKALLELVERLQQRLDGSAIAEAPRTAQPPGPAQIAEASAPSTAAPEASVPSPSVSPAQAKSTDDDHYQDGIVVWKNPEDAKVPFLLKFNVNTQLRYLNTKNSSETFTDHLGVVREVHTRNDITVNRSMFILAGYMFSKKLQYSLTVWTSAGAASIVVAGNIGWRFNKRSRSQEATLAFQAADHLLARSHFFNQLIGAWRTTSFAPALPRASGRTENR